MPPALFYHQIRGVSKYPLAPESRCMAMLERRFSRKQGYSIEKLITSLLNAENRNLTPPGAAEGVKKVVDKHDSMVYSDCMGTMILRNISDDLRKQFKLLCIQKNSNMTAEIVIFMKKEVETAARKG